MPTYTFINKETKKVLRTEIMTISEMEEHIKLHPEEDILPGKPIIGYNWSRKKPDEDFRSILKKIKKDSPGSDMNIP